MSCYQFSLSLSGVINNLHHRTRFEKYILTGVRMIFWGERLNFVILGMHGEGTYLFFNYKKLYLKF